MNYIILGLILCVVLLLEPSYAALYSDTWAVHIEGGEDVVNQIAAQHGFTNLGKVC